MEFQFTRSGMAFLLCGDHGEGKFELKLEFALRRYIAPNDT